MNEIKSAQVLKAGQIFQSRAGTLLQVIEPLSDTHARAMILHVGEGDPFGRGGYDSFRVLGGSTEFRPVEEELPACLAQTLDDVVSEIVRYVGPPLWLGNDGTVVEQLAPIVDGATKIVVRETGSVLGFPVGTEIERFFLMHPDVEIVFQPVTLLELNEYKLEKLQKDNYSLRGALTELIRVIERSPKLTAVEQAKAILKVTE